MRSTSGEENGDALGGTEEGSAEERCPAVRCGLVNPRPSTQKREYRLVVAALSGGVQGCIAAFVLLVKRGSRAQEIMHEHSVALVCGAVQWRPSNVALDVDLRTGVQQRCDDRARTYRACVMEWRLVVAIDGRRGGTRCQ